MPATTRARARTSETRRDELLAAAAWLFRRKGVVGTTVEEVTTRAGVAKGTFYLYFDSKEHLAASVYERLLEGMSEAVAAVLEDAGVADGLDRIDTEGFLAICDRLTEAIIAYWYEQRRTFIAVSDAADTRATAQLMSDHDRRIIELFADGISLGVERGIVAVPDPVRAARFIYFGCQGSCKAGLLSDDDDFDLAELVSSSQALVRKILRPDG